MIFSMFLFIMFILFVLHIVISVWVYRDAISQGRSQEYALIVLVLSFMFPIMGPVVYLLIRNS